jgi:hypothetical protein
MRRTRGEADDSYCETVLQPGWPAGAVSLLTRRCRNGEHGTLVCRVGGVIHNRCDEPGWLLHRGTSETNMHNTAGRTA